MSIGKKIKFFRKRRGMTQRELGTEVGFPPASADVRIAQYESGNRTPKRYVLNVSSHKIHAVNGPDTNTIAEKNRIYTDMSLETLLGFDYTKCGRCYR